MAANAGGHGAHHVHVGPSVETVFFERLQARHRHLNPLGQFFEAQADRPARVVQHLPGRGQRCGHGWRRVDSAYLGRLGDGGQV